MLSSTTVLAALLFASSLSTSATSQTISPTVASQLSSDYAEGLKLGAGDTLRDLKKLPVHTGYVIHTQRYHQGVPVLHESATLQFNHDGKLVSIRSDFRPLDMKETPSVSAVEARITGVKAVWGVTLPKAIFKDNAFDDSLAIDGPTARWIYAVHVPGLLPHQNRTVLVDAVTGEISRVIDPTRHAANSARVFNPHPDPAGELSDNIKEVELMNLTSDTQLRGQWVNAHNCLTDEASRNVYTCDDLIPIFAGGMGGGFGLGDDVSCNDPLLAGFVGQFKNTVFAICGPAHKAAPDGDNGYTGFEPIEADGVAIYPHPSFEDEFAEINLYYHVDKATVFFQSLGHFAAPNALDGAVNLGMPSSELTSCGQDLMAQAGATDHDTGVAAVKTCMDGLEADSKPAFSTMPNAFFSPAGPITSLLGFENGGIFFFQGPNADFGYDGDVIYHEFGHNVVSQAGNNMLTGGNIQDIHGLDGSPGALNEAYADYFAGAITGDAIIGGYVGKKTGMGEGIRRMDHDLACPDFWAGEVHADAWGWAGALWETRALYPQTETDTGTGLEVRIFDRAVFDGLKTLTSNSLYKDAAAATIAAVKGEAALEDPNAEKITEVFERRNVLDCKRIRALTEDTPIAELFTVAAGGGGQAYTPYSPPAVQFKVDVTSVGGGTPAECATFKATTQPMSQSSDGLGIPDVVGGGDGGQQAHQLKLLYNTNGPVEFEYSGNTTVTSAQDKNLIDVVTTITGTTFTAPLYFEKGTTEIHYALINEGGTSPRLIDIKLVNINNDCVNPNPAAPPAADEGLIAPTTAEASGCDCQSATPGSLFLLLLAGLFIRRRRFA